MDDSELEFSIDNADLRITKEGKIQAKAKSGTASVKQNGVLAVTTTSTSWVDTGTRITRREQIKKHPYSFIFGFVLFFATIPLNLWEHDLSFLSQIIVGVYGVALMPINQTILKNPQLR